MKSQMDAAKEVIRMKKEYSNNNGTGYQNTDSAKGLAQSAQDIRSQFGLDESRYGANVGLADALANYAEDFGGGGQGNQGYNQPSGGGGREPVRDEKYFDDERYRNDYENTMRDNADSFFDLQKSEFDRLLSKQISDLEMAYAEAVNSGKLSVREAEAQFEAQKSEIEQSAYQQAQSTKAYGNEMGIGHSQQMIGLQQGDNARTNTMNNTNAGDRDKRINDIRDRIDMLTKQKDLQVTQANTEYGYNIAGARAKADQQYNQSMSEFMNQDYFTKMGMGHDRDMAGIKQQYDRENMDKQQDYNKENMDKQHEYGKENMAIEQGYRKENMKVEFENRFKELSEQSRLRINEMTVGHGFDMKKMEQSLKDAIQLEGVKYGHSASLSAQQNNARMREISANAMKAIEAEQRAYDLSVKRESAKYNPNTPEGKIYLNQKNAKINDIMSMSILEAEMGNVFNNPALENKPVPPKDVKSDWGVIGGMLTGQKKKEQKYESENKAYLDAIKRKEDLMNKYR